MAFPGPALPLWGLALLTFALAVAVVGELVRSLAARKVPILGSLDPIELALLDLYLGGAVFYLIAALPIAAFYPGTIVAVLLAGAIGLAIVVLRIADRDRLRESLARTLSTLARPQYLVTLIATAGLFVLELSATDGIGSSNTFDGSLYTTYTGLLLAHHTLPLTLAPVASGGLSYPQGSTVWFAVAQSLFGLPPLRTTLLVTPLFLALLPLGAFSLGRRLVGTANAGVAMALVFALLAGWSRGLVGGSNDLVFAAPLLLVLVGWSAEWWRPGGPDLRTSVGFGVLVGYAAALNPVGPIWLFLLLPLGAALLRPWHLRAALRWFRKWAVALLAALVPVIPSLYALLEFPSSAGLDNLSSPSTTSIATGESFSQFIGGIDPFLFRPQDQSLSSLPLLRGELAILLLAGVLLLGLARGRFPLPGYLGALTLSGGAMAVALLGIGVLARAGVGPFVPMFRVLSAAELSMLLFGVFSIIASVPLLLAFEEIDRSRDRASPTSTPEPLRPRGRSWGPIPATFLVLMIVASGAAVTAVELPGQLHATYATFSNLTMADVDFLDWASSHLPSSSRVLVGPGSVAEFLPGYVPSVVLLYPMTVGFQQEHPTYWTVVHQLQNGTLNATGWSELWALDPDYVAITENNTALFHPMQPGPLLNANMTAVFHEGGVYLFRIAVTVAAASPPAGRT